MFKRLRPILFFALAVVSCGQKQESGTQSSLMAAWRADCIDGDLFICEVEEHIAAITNELRATQGKAPLEFHPQLSYVSRLWSYKQATKYGMGHYGFPSMRVTDYKNKFGTEYPVSIQGENVAMNRFSANATAYQIANTFTRKQWWNSSGHRANMLGRYKIIGAGVYKSKNGSWYATQIFGAKRN